MGNIRLMRRQNTEIGWNERMLVLHTDVTLLQFWSTHSHLFMMVLHYSVKLT